MNVKKLFSSPAFWALFAMISSACGCYEEVDGKLVLIQPDQNSAAPQSGAPQAKMICPMEWTSPASSSNAGEMPATGAVSFDWTDHPTASDYSLDVITPNGSPVNYDVDGSSKDLFLENYNQTGNYQVVVTALGADGMPLCSITMDFNMPMVAGSAEHVDKGNEGEGSSSVIPSNPVVVPTPTEVEIR